MISARNVLNFFLFLCESEADETNSNLKMQSYCFMLKDFIWHSITNLYSLKKILFWQYGPVVEEIYNEYREYCDGAIPAPRRINTTLLSKL